MALKTMLRPVHAMQAKDEDLPCKSVLRGGREHARNVRPVVARRQSWDAWLPGMLAPIDTHPKKSARLNQSA